MRCTLIITRFIKIHHATCNNVNAGSERITANVFATRIVENTDNNYQYPQ